MPAKQLPNSQSTDAQAADPACLAILTICFSLYTGYKNSYHANQTRLQYSIGNTLTILLGWLVGIIMNNIVYLTEWIK